MRFVLDSSVAMRWLGQNTCRGGGKGRRSYLYRRGARERVGTLYLFEKYKQYWKFTCKHKIALLVAIEEKTCRCHIAKGIILR